MKTKIPWTLSRVVSLLLGVFFFFITAYFGLALLFAVADGINNPSSDTVKDWTGVLGFIYRLVGIKGIYIGAILTILFIGLYFSTTHRLKKQSR
jgi:hypothetical protein